MDLKSAEFIKTASFGGWSLYQCEGQYCFKSKDEDGEWAKTPNGKLLTAKSWSVADKILDDLDSFGPEYCGSDSSLPWQYTWIENFSSMSHQELEDELDRCFLKRAEWTQEPLVASIENLSKVFGVRKDKKRIIREWLSNCTPIQMTAACCIGNAYYSLNVAYELASLITSNADKKKIAELADAVALCLQETPFDVMATFDVFAIYYKSEENA